MPMSTENIIFETNRKLNEKEIKEEKIILESKPQILMLILTADCNLRCIMCPRPLSGYSLTYEAFEKIECLFPYLELINWGGGGEVFLANNFKKFFLKATPYRHIRHDITTNGLLIDEEWTEILVQNNVHLTCSIDSPVRETYEHIRRGARFENLISNIEIINRYKQRYNSKIKLVLNVVVMKCNYKELHLFPEFCKKHGFAQLRFEYLRPVIHPEHDIFTVRKDLDAIEYLKTIMPQIECECRESGIILDSCIRSFLNFNSTSSDDSNNLIFNCKLPWKKLLIDGSSKGRVTPDCLCPHLLGNIFDNSIEEIWNGEVMQLYRRNILNRTALNWCSSACSIYERGNPV